MILAIFLFGLLGLFNVAETHVIVRFRGQFGNQLFQAAAGIALAKDNQCEVYFPDFDRLHLPTESRELEQLKKSYHWIFKHIPSLQAPIEPDYVYSESNFDYHPIPYLSNTEIVGFFVSEKFFSKHRDLILKLFASSS